MRDHHHGFDRPFISPSQRNAMLAMLLVVSIAVCVASLALRGRNDSGNSENTSNPENEIGQLVLELRESDSVKSDNSAIELDRIRRKIEMAEKILSLDPGEQDRQFAIYEKLSAMIARERVNFENGVSNDIESTDLAGYSVGFRESDDNRVRAQASLGETVAAISRFLQNDSSNVDRQDLLQTAEDRIQAVASLAVDDLDFAQTLYEWVQVVRRRAGEESARGIANAFINGFSESNDNYIQELIADLESGRNWSSNGLKDFLGVTSSERDQAIGQFVQQADKLLQTNDLGQQVCLGIVRKAGDLLALGRTAMATSIYDQVAAHKLSSEELVRDELKILKTRLNLFEQPLAVSAFRDFEGNSVDFALPYAKMRLLFFISSTSKTKSLAEFAELIVLLRPRMMDQTLEVVVVYLDDGQQPGDRSDIKTAASRTDQWKAWLLDTQTEAGRQFLQNSALGSAPWLIILDNKHNVVALGTPNQVAEEVVSKPISGK